jgi:UDP-N-acetylglucosamine diphosphorylase/glucosamine-1-phosphate N-acetyltransferase
VTALYFYDDSRARQFEPFALTRPASELRAGAMTTRRRWERATGLETKGFIGAAHLADFDEAGAPPCISSGELPAGAIVVNSRFIISLGAEVKPFDLLMNEGAGCAIRLARALPVKDLANGLVDLGSLQTSMGGRNVQGRWISDVWDYIATLGDQLKEDIPALGKKLTSQKPPAGSTMGDGAILIHESAQISPYVVFDTADGPIYIQEGAVIHPFTRLVGPLAIGCHCQVMGDRVATSSFGDFSKVRGEVSNSIVLGYSNKGHEGFLGHSYLGRWVNLGALTTTSNLKNTYGTVQLWTPAGVRDSGQQFLGTFFGDHVKTGIGMMLSTGTVLGSGANIYGSHAPPKAVRPFSWGDDEPYGEYDLEKFVVTAERMMERRHVALSEKGKKQLRAAHGARWDV